MAKKILGIEIGNYSLKISVCSNNRIEKVVTERIPDNLVREDAIVSWEAMSDFIRETVKKNQLNVKQAAVVLPESLCYIKRVSVVPAMTVEQLIINLPYEFHDYITEEKDKYIYDYAVIHEIKDEKGVLMGHDLMAVAVLKETVDKYRTLLRRAGIKMVKIAPDFCAFETIIKKHEETAKTEKKDCGILDIGESAVRLKFFSKGTYEITRIMEPGSRAITGIIAEYLGTDEHIADIAKINNENNVIYTEECHNIYGQIAVEIMRVLNFYNFNHPENTLERIYYCGGGSRNEALIKEIESTMEPEMVSITELSKGIDCKDNNLITCCAAIGIALN